MCTSGLLATHEFAFEFWDSIGVVFEFNKDQKSCGGFSGFSLSMQLASRAGQKVMAGFSPSDSIWSRRDQNLFMKRDWKLSLPMTAT